MPSPRVSIILPTWNGEAELRRMLPQLNAQEIEGGFEICAVDSSSTDRSRELLAEAGASVMTIPQSEFRHGATRNRCAERARGEFLVFLSQDAEPADKHFLRELVKVFADPRVAGASARVLPRPEDDPLTRRTVLELPEASEREAVRDLDHVGGVWNLSATERADYLRFNDVASAIRASVFRELPFPDLEFGEDFAWAARALTAGWRLRFVPSAVVYHAHSYSPLEAYERYRVDAAFHRRIHGHKVRPDALSAARGFVYEVRQDLLFLRTEKKDRLRHVLRSPCLRAAQVLGQYVGSRDESSAS
jgi:GT2 family glycosyltransferase